MDGVININKPRGITSHDVVYKLRKILGVKKIGHTGTLDPDAVGVLPMCIGKGTKIAEYLMASDKQYVAEVVLGAITDTQDSSGMVLKEFDVNVTEEEIRRVIPNFIGEIEQIPPMYSAIKIDGKRLYELARLGTVVERKPRKITVSNINLLNIDLENKKFIIKVDCSKGTYIRTLCNDIGEKLGCGAFMSGLKRTRSGRFDISQSVLLEEVESQFSRGNTDFLVSIDKVLDHYEKVVIADKNARRVKNGIQISVAGLNNKETYRVFDESGELLTLSKQENGKLIMLKSFY